MIDALVLAGSLNNGPLCHCSAAKYEALIKIGPEAIVSYVIKALLQSGEIRRVMVVGPPELQEILPPRIIYVPSAQTVMENLRRGCGLAKGQLLVTTADIPLLTPESVQGFLKLCGDRSADLYFPVVPREIVEQKYPGVKRTYIHFKEGIVTGGNIFLVNPRVVDRCLTVGQELVDLRKSPLALARRVGLKLLLKLLCRALSLREAEARASQLLGIAGRAVICRYPEIGVDVDKPSDLKLVSQALGYHFSPEDTNAEVIYRLN